MKRQLVVFKVGGEEFAVDIMATKEVVVMREVTPVPETDKYVEGIMNLRGSLVPVLDLRKRLRAPSAGTHKDRRIIIIHHEGKLVGLIVDGASEVIRVSDDMIESPPDVIAESEVGYISGIIAMKDRFITLIDLKRALTEDVAQSLDQVMELLASGREASLVGCAN
ncbi:MAG TPA: chemotaxis protein CheW [Blastocatellia bacterium]|nr:chemotaxis protein CheW [Blastocatellia bacterium]